MFINPSFFEFYIDWRKTEKDAKDLGIEVKRTKELTANMKAANKFGYALQDCGDIIIRQRVDNPDVRFHKEQKKDLML